MDRRLTFVALTLAAILSVSVATVYSQDAAPRVLIDTKNGELAVEVPSGGTAWCAPELTFTVRAEDERFLDGSETDAQGRRGRLLLQRLLGGLRAMLKSECPQATAITLNGFVDDVFLYRGHASRDNAAGEWILIDLPVALVEAPPPPPVVAKAETPPPPPRRAAIGECDELAAHPDDPKKPKGVAGVADDDIKPGLALKACEEAMAVEPDNTRLKFQLARALISYDKPAEGLELMTDAAEDGHGAAVAALADITLYGLLDETPDPGTAKALYLKAAKLGFKPAAALAAAIEANPKEDTTQQVAAEPQYHKPDRLAVMLTGEALPGTGAEFISTLAYSTRVVAGIVHQCPGKGIDGVTSGQVINAVYKRAGPLITFAGLNAVNDGAYAELQQQGMDDGYALAVTAGCDSPKVLGAVASVRRTLQ